MPTSDQIAVVTNLLNLLPWIFAFFLFLRVYQSWIRERDLDRIEKREERTRIEMLQRQEQRHREQEQREAFYRAKKEDEVAIQTNAGGGSGGYIVIDLPDTQRALFQDLLKGFEEYAQLKGYEVAFSADTTYSGHIAFKFTLTNPDIVVSGERVRKDLKEYIEKVSRGESLDDIPRIISVQEHDVLMTTLKNRISFLQHSYNLAKTSEEFYERLLRRTETLPILPPPSVVVQTGGMLSAPNYNAINSPQAQLGNNNSAVSQIYIAQNYTDRKNQIDHLARLLQLLNDEPRSDHVSEAARTITNIKEELESAETPEPGRVTRWIQKFKELCQLGSLGTETVAAAKELFKLFGVGG